MEEEFLKIAPFSHTSQRGACGISESGVRL